MKDFYKKEKADSLRKSNYRLFIIENEPLVLFYDTKHLVHKIVFSFIMAGV